MVANLYTFVFARPSTQGVNDRLLHLAMRGRGYDLGPEPTATGELKFLRTFAKTNPVLCIDIGANLGKYSKLLLETSSADVIAFEPFPQSFQRLLDLTKSHPERFTPEPFGVGQEDATLVLNYGVETTLASFSAEVNRIGYVGDININEISVPVVSLDSYIYKSVNPIRQIDLIKIDTEGFELEVLRGARRTISEIKPKFIQIEFNWHQLMREQSLRGLAELLPGYDVFQILPYGTGLARRDVNAPDTNIFHFSNFVFVRSDVHLDEVHEIGLKR
jgi:FkbM family methyltransferase